MGEIAFLTQIGQLTASGAIIVLFSWMLYQMPKFLREERESRERTAASYEEAAKAMADATKEAAIAVAKTTEEEAKASALVATQSITSAIESGEERSRYEREACERQHKELMELIDSRHDRAEKQREVANNILREVKHETANLAQQDANRRALEKMKREDAPRTR